MIALVDNHGYSLSPLTLAPVNEVDMGLWPQGLKELKRVARAAGLPLPGAVLNLDAGFASKTKRKGIFHAGLRPNIKETPRNRQKPQRGRKRFFEAVLYKLRFIGERTFAWEDKFKRLRLRFETKQSHPLGFKLIAFPLSNLREFCGGCNLQPVHSQKTMFSLILILSRKIFVQIKKRPPLNLNGTSEFLFNRLYPK